MTSRKQLFEIFDEITEKAFQIMEGKNSDYASNEDSLANFRSSEVLNVDPRKALLIRMLDKIKRQVNYIERGELSVDSAEDDVVDLINYSVLLHALNREEEDNVPSFCDTPNACHYDGCMCERTDKFVEGEQRDNTKRFVKSIYFHRKTDVFDVLYNNGYGKIIPEKDVIDIQQSYDSPNYLDWLETENEIYVVEDE